MHRSQVMHTVWFTIPVVYLLRTHITLYITCYRHQDVCVTHRSCALFESTMPFQYSCINIHISPNTRNSTDIMIRTWLKVMHTVWVQYSTYTHNTHIARKSHCYRHRDAYMIHKWCTVRVHNIKFTCHTHTHIKLKLTIDIRMHTWFTSDAHSMSTLSRVYIPTYTHHVLNNLL